MKQISLYDVLSSFFTAIIGNEDTLSSASPLLAALKAMYVQKPNSAICSFNLDDKSIAVAINQLKDSLCICNPDCFKVINVPLT